MCLVMSFCVHAVYFPVHLCVYIICAYFCKSSACLDTHTPCALLCIIIFVYLYFVCAYLCVRADAGDSEGFLEDGLAGKLSLNCHGYQFGRGGQGEFVIRDTKCAYVIWLN